MNWGRGLPALLACLLGATLVVACDAHSKPSAVPTLAPSASPTAAATHAPTSPPASSSPPRPTATDKASLESAYPSAAAQEDAAVQVVRDFFDGMNYQIDTGSEAKVYKTFSQDCTKCFASVLNLQKLFENGSHLKGGHFHITRVNDVYPTGEGIVAVGVTDTEDAGEQIDSSGKSARTFDAVPPTRLTFYVLARQVPPVIENAVVQPSSS